MAFDSLGFVFALLTVAAIFPSRKSLRSKQCLLAVCNLAFLGTYLRDLRSWVAMAAFVGSGYVAGNVLRARPSRAGLTAYLAVLVAAFVILKQYVPGILPENLLRQSIAIVGLSYMLFRQIHFVVDCKEGQIEKTTIWDYANYQLGFCTLLAGPIQRFPEFRESWHTLLPPAEMADILQAFLRFFIGIVKLAGLSAMTLFAYNKLLVRLVDGYESGSVVPITHAIALFAAVFYLYPIYVYLNFSGYCDVAIAAGTLVGLHVPENFDQPYLSRNMLEFWTRWHRTLGFWIRDYLFTPVYKFLAERNFGSTATLAVVSYFLAFLLAGIWHGTTANYAVFGALNGVGVSCAKLWEMSLIRRRGRPYFKQYLQSQRVKILAIIATLHYFCVTMLFFSGPFPDCMLPIQVLVRSLGALISEGSLR